MTYRLFLAFLAILAVLTSACTDRASQAPETAPQASEAPPEEPAVPEGPTDWDPQGVAAIEALAERLRAVGVPCEELEISLFVALAEDYEKRFGQRPAAEASCMTSDDEDLTFYVFADAADLERFMERKRSILCSKAVEAGVPHFPGYPYVKGDVWFIQPDERATAEKIAPLLGATAGLAACPQATDVVGEAPAAGVAPADAGDEPIIVVFADAEPDFGEAPLAVQFRVMDPYNHLVDPTFHWDFGDGQTSDKRSPSHTYEKPGEYTAKLKVADRGGEDEDEVEISVE